MADTIVSKILIMLNRERVVITTQPPTSAVSSRGLGLIYLSPKIVDLLTQSVSEIGDE